MTFFVDFLFCRFFFLVRVQSRESAQKLLVIEEVEI